MQSLPPSALPGISPTRGESDKTRAHRSLANVAVGASRRREPLSPLVGEMPGRAEGGIRSAIVVFILIILSAFHAPAQAASKAAVEKQFHAWIESGIWAA